VSAFYDLLETRAPDARERALLKALPRQVAHAKAKAPHYAKLFADIEPREMTSRAALARLPVTRKSNLIALQAQALPFGGLAATTPGNAARIFMSPGPIYEPEGRARDFWRLARALYAAGMRSGEVLHNSFSYHLTPAGAMLESAAQALGCAVIPGGVGQTELQCRAIADLRPSAYVGTPSFLKILLAKGKELGSDLSSLKRALVSGEAFPPPLQQEIAASGIAAFQCYATADLGLIAYESEARQGLILDESIILELVRPGTGDPVPAGEVGEVVVTVLGPDYPLIRFATGDLSALLPGPSPCGRTNLRIKGWMGRADQTTKVRGLFVHPEQLAELAKRHKEIARYRLVVSDSGGGDVMTLKIEVPVGTPPEIEGKIGATLTDLTKLRGSIEIMLPGSLPADGKVIEDARPRG